MARPTKYKPHLLKIIDNLIKEYLELGINRRKNIAGPEEKEPVIISVVDFPSMEKLSFKLNISVDTIYAWSDPESPYYKKEFSESIKKWNNMTKLLLKEASLSGTVKEKVSMFLLGNLKVIDYNKGIGVNVNNINNTVNNSNEITVNVIEKAHEKLKIEKNNEIIDIPINLPVAGKEEPVEVKAIPEKEKDNTTISPIEALKEKINSIKNGQ